MSLNDKYIVDKLLRRKNRVSVRGGGGGHRFDSLSFLLKGIVVRSVGRSIATSASNKKQPVHQSYL